MCGFRLPPPCEGDIHSTGYYTLHLIFTLVFHFSFSFTSATPFLHLAMALPRTTHPPKTELTSSSPHPSSRANNPIG